MKNYVALGDFVLDVYHDVKGVLGYYVGGSVWNDLLNLSSLDPEARCSSVATCGKDWAGDFILQKLCEAGIDTTNVSRLNRETKRFHIIIDAEHTKSQLECPGCKETIWYSDSRFPKDIPYTFYPYSDGIVIIDSLKKSILELAKTFRSRGWFLAADIGYINHLRYMSNENVKALVCGAFDLIQMTKRVYKFLLNKLSCYNETMLFELLGCRYLNITDGENGSSFIFRDILGNIKIKFEQAISTQVLDPTGAGDAYFSKLLQLLDNKGNFTVSVDAALYEAGIYASNRVAVAGANGKYEKIEIPLGGCKICGGGMKKKATPHMQCQKIATNANYLLDRTLRALESGASQKLNKVLKSVKGQVLMVGTGGSFAAAEFAAKCVTQYHPIAIAHACHPRDIIINGLNKIDTVMLFSYSGKTKDIKRVYDFCQKECVPVYIITKYGFQSNDDLYEEKSIISYSASKSTTKERGFISMAGTLIPMCIFGDIYYSNPQKDFMTFLKDCFAQRSHEFSNDKYFFDLPSRKITIDIFSGTDTNCTAIDLESKFIESGLARVTVHEKKDFSHGRFNIIEKYTPNLIIFLDNVNSTYSKKLYEYLKKRDGIYICRISSEKGKIWGDLDLVIAAEFLSKYLSKALFYDMAKPDYPKDAMALYRYSNKDML